jgi:hypothetical protein
MYRLPYQLIRLFAYLDYDFLAFELPDFVTKKGSSGKASSVQVALGRMNG